MNKNKIITAAAIVFFFAGIAQFIRIFYGWKLKINEW